ncbi:MAG: SprT-like domain-containing protein [Bacteriovorax sp.]|nr:SprT-like domain-containing protein [Bacteriovorax sp.]
MFLHSKTISAFITRVRIDVREIVNNEMGLKMERSRIHFKGILYPLNVVVFEDHTRLGYFDSRTYELGLSKKLMYQAKDEVLKNIIRHELAHFMCYLIHGPKVLHGEEFHDACRNFGWGPEVYGAYANLEHENDKIGESNEKTEKLLLRLKKLLALASSDNTHERELATLKANQLLLEHNLNLNQSQNSDEETVYVKRVLVAARKNSKHVAIYEILKTFFVSPVFNHGRGIFYLEVIGDKTSVELADYVASFLDRELEIIWKQTQKENPHFKGISSKNSFFTGVARGYVEKIEKQKTELASKNDLVLIEKNIQKNLKIVYPRIGHASLSSGAHNEDAHSAGKIKGSNLSIRQALDQGKASKVFLLS